MSTLALMACIELGLVYGLMTLGLFLSYRILDIPDLTVDGSFTLGAAVSMVFTCLGHPFLGIVIGILAGALAGFVTAFLQTKLLIQPILAGILTMTALYSINLMVMGGKPNIGLPLGKQTIFTFAEQLGFGNSTKIVVGSLIVLAALVIVILFLHTSLGLAVRATGDNETMVRSSSINVDFTKIVGLMFANALVALSGAVLAQSQKFADANMGVGTVVMGLASLIIGEIICSRKTISLNAVGAIVGSIVYRFIIGVAIECNLSASSMKLITAIIVTVAISYPTIKARIQLRKQKKRGRSYAQDTTCIQNV